MTLIETLWKDAEGKDSAHWRRFADMVFGAYLFDAPGFESMEWFDLYQIAEARRCLAREQESA